MAKSKSAPMPTKNEKYLFPSHYGSHTSMVDQGLTEQLGNAELVVLKDEEGYYVTEKKRLDTKLADANRYANSAARDMRAQGIEPKVE
jgi:hypothetical protein